ncbi:lysozyme [Dulcicalothrix desertica PCC 7102]|uniref:Lysozyme n=1 Tax=Dulcicalothrix desertica PCC 7102 TaxID=232991 RepID=A0A433V602_9CYAN|nr:glycoside hydrolase family protein [Dulcicalothrix desertica]RUT01532.1 lysozyme [Dulcicalothrix desertica PCC 7102]
MNFENLLKLAIILRIKSLTKVKWQAIIIGVFCLILVIIIWHGLNHRQTKGINEYTPLLVMKGGDPYIRALMRTISASESQDINPYTQIYGGEHFSDFSRHPNKCVKIVSGLHQGECSTAAGRYQILTVTWQEKSEKYHSKLPKNLSINHTIFTPQAQDKVVYAWLNDRDAWKVDIALLLKQGKLNQVLKILSGTWTSLGYGKENNSITPLLSQVYQKVLAQELAQTNSSSSN